jgi:general secretion pathway protein M
MIDRARDWWMGRTTRERWMLGVMFALIGFLLLWLAVVRPINAARDAAQLRLVAATEDAGRIAAVAEGMKIARRTAPPTLTVTLPAAIGSAGESNGITLSRLDQSGTDRANIGISAVSAPALFAWLSALEGQGIIVDKLTLRTNSDATLAAEGVLRLRGR